MSPEAMKAERDDMLMKKHASYDEELGESIFDVAQLYELNLAHDLANEQKKTLNFIDEDDLFEDILFKHHQMLKRVEYNFFKFNEQLQQEIRSEEQAQADLMTSQQIIETQLQLESLYRVAGMVQYDLVKMMEDSRTTLDQIMSKENMDARRNQQAGSFDVSKVKLNESLQRTLDQAHKDIDIVIQNTKKTHERNLNYLKEFEEIYEKGGRGKANKSTGRDSQRLDPQIVQEIETGVRAMKEKIVYEYVESLSWLTIFGLICIFGGLGFTYYKVNKLVNKAHLF